MADVVRRRRDGVMGEGQDMAGILGAAGGAFSGRERPATRPPPNLPAAGRPRDGPSPGWRGPDALDRFAGAAPRASPRASPPRNLAGINDDAARWALPGDLRAGAVGGGDAAQLSQMQQRLGALEQENAAMKRTIDQRDSEVRKALQSEQVVKGLARQMAEIDETLRRASNAHDSAARRVRALEDAVGYGSDSGGAHGARLHTLEETVRSVQQTCQNLESGLAHAAGERAQVGQKAQASVEDVQSKLFERLDGEIKSMATQLREVQESTRQQEFTTKAAMSQISEDMSSQFASVNGDVVPGIDRALRDQIAELRRVVESSVTQVAEDVASTRANGESSSSALRKELKELQGVAQKGLLTLRAESEKQGKTLASIVKEEIATRSLNFETVNKQIEEIRLQLDADMSANGNDLASAQEQIQSQIETAQGEVEGIREELNTLRGETLDSYLENLRGELLSVVEQRHGACMETVKGYGLATEQELRTVASNIVKEELARTEADSGVHKLIEQLRTDITVSVEDWHTAMDRFDAQHAAEQKLRQEAEAELRAEAEAGLAALTTRLEETDAALMRLVEDVREELHAKVDQTAVTINSTITLYQKETERGIDSCRTEASARADALESSLEREIATVRGEISGVEEELTKLQDESRQTLLGFREYMDTELGLASTAREEIRESLKADIEASYQDSKQECEFAVNNLDERLREHVQDEVGGARDDLKDEMKELGKELSIEIGTCKEELEELGTLRPEVQGLRVRVTAGAESLSSLDNRTKSALASLQEECSQQAAASAATLSEMSAVISQTSETVEETAGRLSACESGGEEAAKQLTALEEGLGSLKGTVNNAEQRQRIYGTRMDERLSKLTSRVPAFEELSERVDANSAQEAAATERISQEMVEVNERLKKFGKVLAANSEADDAREADTNERLATLNEKVDKITEAREADMERLGAESKQLAEQLEGKLEAAATASTAALEAAQAKLNSTLVDKIAEAAESSVSKEDLHVALERVRPALSAFV